MKSGLVVVILTIHTNIDEELHSCPTSIRYLTAKLSCYCTMRPTVECNKFTPSVSVVSRDIRMRFAHCRHPSAIRKVELSSSHLRRSISTASGAVSVALQSIISLSNVSPQHNRAIGVGYSI